MKPIDRFTFENFVPEGVGPTAFERDALKAAFERARVFAENPDGLLVIWGSIGSGKTHLAMAIVNFAISKRMAAEYESAPDLLDTLYRLYQLPDMAFQDRLNELRASPLLVIDNLGVQANTPWAAEKLFQLLDHRYSYQLPTVVICSEPPASFEPHIRSRLNDVAISHIFIHTGDFRTGETNVSKGLNRHREKTFDSFLPREDDGLKDTEARSLKNALRAAEYFSAQRLVSRNDTNVLVKWLVFVGPYGCGKTHLAAAIAHEYARKGLVEFIHVPELMDYLRSTFYPNSTIRYTEEFEKLRQSELLILDDIGGQVETPWAREKLYQVLEYRRDYQKTTILTSAQPESEIDGRIKSLIMSTNFCDIYIMNVPPYSVKRQGKRSSMPKAESG